MGAPLAMKHDVNYVHNPNENAVFRDSFHVIEPFVRSTLQKVLSQIAFPNCVKVEHVMTRSEKKRTTIHVAGQSITL